MIKLEKITNFIDKDIKNVFEVDIPYSYLKNNTATPKKKQVIFFGFDFKNIVYLDRSKFIKRMNLCLDYIRKQCSGQKLYYKPHPNETDEFKSYNLKSFKILDRKESAEIYFLKNLNRIEYVFAVASVAAINAYKLGINSYVFYKAFKDVFFDENLHLYFELMFSKMPKGFFINSLDQKLPRQSYVFGKNNNFLLSFFKNLLYQPKKQKVWIIVNHPRFLLEIVALAQLLRKNIKVNTINLIISKHKRWEVIDIDYLKYYFKNIYFFPRYVYRLRPRNLISFLKTKLKIRQLNISRDDLIVNFSPCEFIENMVISSFKKCKKINFMPKNEYEQQINTKFLKDNKFSFNKASFIFNKIIEPILGMNKVLGLFSQSRNEPFMFIRYEKPLNKVYNYVLFYGHN